MTATISGEEVGDRDRDLALELLPGQRLEQSCAHAAGRHDVDVLEPLELVTSDRIADLGVVGPHHAGEPLVHQVLHDQIDGRIDNAAQHQRSGAGDDAGFDQIVAVRGQAEPDAGRSTACVSRQQGSACTSGVPSSSGLSTMAERFRPEWVTTPLRPARSCLPPVS